MNRAALLLAILALAPAQERRESTVGMPARIDELVLPGSELEAVPADSKSPLVLRLGKASFARAEDLPFDDALAYLTAMLGMHLQSEDVVEGVTAFVEKREPRWTGR